MPTLKKQSRILGKQIRKETGLPFPLCMRAGHMIVRGKGFNIEFTDLFSPHIKEEHRKCGDGCCSDRFIFLNGPKGQFRVNRFLP